MLYDQFGHKIQKITTSTVDPRYANPGYKQTAGDGKGSATYEEYDPVTGINRVLERHADGTWTQKKYQNVQAIVDMNKIYAADHKPHSKAPFQRQTAIPQINFWDIMEKCGWQAGKNGGEYDKKKFDQIINDSDYRAFKTVPGRISCRYNSWV